MRKHIHKMVGLLVLFSISSADLYAVTWSKTGTCYQQEVNETKVYHYIQFSCISNAPKVCGIPPGAASLMPFVDVSKNIVPAIGFNEIRLIDTTEQPALPADGAFRISCGVSHMSNDDPLVFPNSPGASHHHTFFGNTLTNAASDLSNMANVGNSTCLGGGMNKSAYWIPTMINTKTGAPISPLNMLVYYKSGEFGFHSTEPIVQPPKGLRMVAGNSKGVPVIPDPEPWAGHFTCNTPTGTTPWAKGIPNCNAGDKLTYHIDFPQCWDGKNLDSPNHKDHMAERVYLNNTSTEMHCPTDHPVRIPAIAFNVDYANPVADDMKNWRFSSDNYSTTFPGGYSAHADWVNGWDEKLFAIILRDCIQSFADCHAHLAGNGKQMF